MITNAQISRVLKEMAALYEMRDVPFRPRAYEKAAMGVEEADEELARIFEETGIEGLMDVPGFGKGFATHVAELISTGHLKKYEQLKKELSEHWISNGYLVRNSPNPQSVSDSPNNHW